MSCPDRSGKLLQLFSDTCGGWIVLGVKENGNDFVISGVSNAEKIKQDYLNTFRGTKFKKFRLLLI